MSDTGKGSNSIVSMLHYFFEEHSMGETMEHLHANNCVGYNKNYTMLHYLIWRFMVELHKQIILSFLVLQPPEAEVSPNQSWLFVGPKTGCEFLSRGQRRSVGWYPVGRGRCSNLQLDINVCRPTQEAEADQNLPPLQNQCIKPRCCSLVSRLSLSVHKFSMRDL